LLPKLGLTLPTVAEQNLTNFVEERQRRLDGQELCFLGVSGEIICDRAEFEWSDRIKSLVIFVPDSANVKELAVNQMFAGLSRDQCCKHTAGQNPWTYPTNNILLIQIGIPLPRLDACLGNISSNNFHSRSLKPSKRPAINGYTQLNSEIDYHNLALVG
jgi:hypothetical protein